MSAALTSSTAGPAPGLTRTASASASAGTSSCASLDGPTRVGSRAPSPDSVAHEKLAPASADLEAAVDDEKAEEAAGESPVPTVLTFPDGGADAWRTVAAAAILVFATFGLSNIGGVFVAEYRTNQLSSYPLSKIAWITSTHLFLTFASSFLAGWLFDHGYFRHQLAVGSALWILGIFSLSASTNYTQIFLSHAVCLGLGVGIMFGPSLSAVGLYFGKLAQPAPHPCPLALALTARPSLCRQEARAASWLRDCGRRIGRHVFRYSSQ